MKGMKVTEEEMSNRFDLKKLFQAAARGDVTMLDGLHDYLTKNLKKLSHSECEENQDSWLSPAWFCDPFFDNHSSDSVLWCCQM